MSDHWEFYPCQIGEATAFISYDHGIGETLDDIEIETLLKIRIRFLAPDEGLPTTDEFPVLTELEDAVREFVEAQGGAYVGRITTGGWRYLYSYLQSDARTVQPFLGSLSRAKGYDIEFSFEDDPDHRGYWDDLRPSPADWRVIQDLRVIESLRDHGDALRKQRPIDHFATFPTPESRHRFRLWAEAEGFAVTAQTEPADHPPRYGIQITHESIPRLTQITRITLPLMTRINTLGGDYDGWGTTVVPRPE